MAAFNNTAQNREQLFSKLYKSAFPAVAAYVSKMGGSFDEAKDVFQDALIAYYEKILINGTVINTTENGYLFGTARNLWLQRYRTKSREQPLEAHADDVTGDDEAIPSTNKLLAYLATAGKRCMDMLKAFYYDKLDAEEIATTFGYSGVRSATVQKYKCLEKVRDTVKQNALQYADFIE
ncbi:sigma-70 family RNA polymerase sigma factor [Mucilaginibacter roseus]|uniref:Sigma-70 family RNA polymerase sigma factor n=1 Tax=Mucilaginibacter roseus TaxID=1528868 RepID=A0ABS8U3Z7_9SPHI|nr:sigma-70 family RNA polymerase sigma factor [Mucilaginibacter roseus]MCD8740243.1 sigma-70 family RNA polymerase sigma factor [Mucilaginibacter roseus]